MTFCKAMALTNEPIFVETRMLLFVLNVEHTAPAARRSSNMAKKKTIAHSGAPAAVTLNAEIP